MKYSVPHTYSVTYSVFKNNKPQEYTRIIMAYTRYHAIIVLCHELFSVYRIAPSKIRAHKVKWLKENDRI